MVEPPIIHLITPIGGYNGARALRARLWWRRLPARIVPSPFFHNYPPSRHGHRFPRKMTITQSRNLLSFFEARDDPVFLIRRSKNDRLFRKYRDNVVWDRKIPFPLRNFEKFERNYHGVNNVFELLFSKREEFLFHPLSIHWQHLRSFFSIDVRARDPLSLSIVPLALSYPSTIPSTALA